MQKETPENSGTIKKTPETVLIRIAFLSLIVNIGLVIAKLGLSWISGSLALRADGIHSFVDVIMSVALIFGIKISSRKIKGYPYGLYKVENIISVAISFLIFLTAYEIALEAISSHGSRLPYSVWVLAVVALMVPVPYILGMYEVKVGRKYNSPSLTADGEQHKVDVLTASIVFFALLGQYFGIPLDSIAAIIVVIFIIRSGWYILKDSMRTLLDASIDHDTLDTIRAAILSDPIVRSVKRITGRNSGRFIFVEATVTMAGSDLEKAHNASERIEEVIRKLVPNIERVLIHYEPEMKTHLRYAVPLQDREGDLSPHFGEAPYFALIDFNVKECKFERQEIIPNRVKESEQRKGIMVAKMLLDSEPDVVLTKRSLSGKSALYVFGAANIMVKETGAESLSEVIVQVERELRGENTIEE